MPSRYAGGYNATRCILTAYWRRGERPSYESEFQEAATDLENMRIFWRPRYACNFKFYTYAPEEMSAYDPNGISALVFSWGDIKNVIAIMLFGGIVYWCS